LVNRRPTLSLIRSAIAPALALLVIVHFAGFAMIGPNGLLSLGGYQEAIAKRRVELTAVEAERDRLARHAALLNPRKVDPDFADELVRRETGQVRPDEVIIPRNQ
jgi:cell division protein FtsB